ncbi:MAG: hypothetical protein OEZ39_02320 [Gammaproteobacteria bacterium]|nr:hypothetical protein [Gammaproteobacteria bacterium]MDH5650689.1 hypothetical protein [Gammaproteobacteria bacterium]
MLNPFGRIIKTGFLAFAVAGIALTAGCSDEVKDDVDLNRVLDVTADTLTTFQKKVDAVPEKDRHPDKAFLEFTKDLQDNFNKAQPPVYNKGAVLASAQTDASIMAYSDTNQNGKGDRGEEIFMIEIDGQKNRIIATSYTGAVSDHSFSGTGFLAGYLVSSLLNRQRAAGVDTNKLSNKSRVSATQAARSRAGSGSHSKGK